MNQIQEFSSTADGKDTGRWINTYPSRTDGVFDTVDDAALWSQTPCLLLVKSCVSPHGSLSSLSCDCSFPSALWESLHPKHLRNTACSGRDSHSRSSAVNSRAYTDTFVGWHSTSLISGTMWLAGCLATERQASSTEEALVAAVTSLPESDRTYANSSPDKQANQQETKRLEMEESGVAFKTIFKPKPWRDSRKW